MRVFRPLRRRVPVTLGAAGIALAGTFVLAPAADAHGSVIDPATRNYGCWERWGEDHLNPEMATLDPMCWQVWQDDPNAMWNWNGLYIDGVAGDHEGAIPDGQLCSGGMTENGRYAKLDTPGEWVAAEIDDPANFSVKLHDAALHGADYIRVFVSDDGYDPTTEALAWDDLELVEETGRFLPGEGERESGNQLGGVSVTVPVSAPEATGRRVIYTIWKASHSDQTYYLCSDVIFPGADPGAGGEAPGAGEVPVEGGAPGAGEVPVEGGAPGAGEAPGDSETCQESQGFVAWLQSLFGGDDCSGSTTALIDLIRELLLSLLAG